MDRDHDDHQHGLGGRVQLVSVDEVDEGVGEVQEALQDVADALGASQAAQPCEQGSPPLLASLTDHLHLRGCNEKFKCKSASKQY